MKTTKVIKTNECLLYTLKRNLLDINMLMLLLIDNEVPIIS